MNEVWPGIVTILVAIIGVATLAVIVSKNSNTSSVIQAGASGFSNALGTALSPISSSGNFSVNNSYPSTL